ncbi:MAG: hypothetical protein Q8Q01_00845 [archaeon]|nr:hypothetical protein [archaeon]
MTRIIPRELIKHLEWTPGQTPPAQPIANPIPIVNPVQTSPFSIDDIMNGKTFYDGSMPKALRQAIEYAGSSGIVANMPEFVAAKAKAEKSHAFWQNWYTVLTEENIGIDKKGSFYTRGEPVLVVMHGGGILTPDRIQQAYDEGLISNSAKYRNEEFDALLEGRLLDGTSFPLYRLEDIKDGRSNLPHQFGVVLPYKTAQDTKSGYHQKKPFLENPLVLARTAGSHDYLEAFYEKAKASDGDLGNYHPFSGRDATIPQGRVLFVDSAGGGLFGGSGLGSGGRFVGVAPEAPGARKK